MKIFSGTTILSCWNSGAGGVNIPWGWPVCIPTKTLSGWTSRAPVCGREPRRRCAKACPTNIEVIDRFFAEGEVAEIWLTFSDPQMKKVTKRLTSTYFMARYRRFLQDRGRIHLKTDSNFLFTYTEYMVEKNGLPLEFSTRDLYHSTLAEHPDTEEARILNIRTYYEQQWLDRGLDIKYMRFLLPQAGELSEPEVEIELDEYRSYNRSKRSGLSTAK